MSTARDVSGILAGVRAGLGVLVFPSSMMPADLAPGDPAAALPELGTVEVVLLANPRSAPATVAAFRELIATAGVGSPP